MMATTGRATTPYSYNASPVLTLQRDKTADRTEPPPSADLVAPRGNSGHGPVARMADHRIGGRIEQGRQGAGISEGLALAGQVGQ